MSYLERYRVDPLPAWEELLELGDAVREQPLAEDARAVADEAMARAHRNLDRVVKRLDEIGYRFVDRKAAVRPPDDDVEGLITTFEAEIGPLPLSLHAFYRRVGGVDWRGEMPRWRPPGELIPDSPWNGIVTPEHCYADPLMVPTLRELLEECQERKDELDVLEADEGLMVLFSPDYLTKVEDSGGLYGLLLPDASLDTDLDWLVPTTFTDYLRDTLRWGGFPGLVHYRAPDLEVIEALRAELEPF